MTDNTLNVFQTGVSGEMSLNEAPGWARKQEGVLGLTKANGREDSENEIEAHYLCAGCISAFNALQFSAETTVHHDTYSPHLHPTVKYA